MKNRQALRPPKQLHPAVIALIDILLIALCLNIFALFDHVLPRSQQKVVYTAPSASPRPTESLEPDITAAQAAMS